MKKILLYLSILILILTSKSAYSINEQYRSVANGNWSSLAVWQMSTNNGATWVPAVTNPTSASGVITVNTKIIVDYNVLVDEFILNTNDTLIIGTNVTLTVEDGSGPDLTLKTNSVINGPGIINIQGLDVICSFETTPKIYTPVTIISGKTTLSGNVVEFHGSLTIAISTELFINNSIKVYNDLLNNGLINSLNGSNWEFLGSSLTNNGILSSWSLILKNPSMTISGTGTFTTNYITVDISSTNITLLNDMTFSSGFFNFSKGILNLNGKTLTFDKGTFSIDSGTFINLGLIQTQGTISIIVNDYFNAPLKVQSGKTIISGGSNYSKFTEPITIDSGDSLFINTGYCSIYSNILNNGTIYGNPGNSFKFYGNSIINNGVIKITNVSFDNGIHTLLGTGFITSTNFLIGSVTSLSSDHKMDIININSGATFDISNKTLSVSNSHPISNNGTFATTNSTVEFNGTSLQSIPVSNVNFAKIRINNPAGVNIGGTALTLNDTVSFINGDFNILGNILTLTSNAYLIETPGNTVIGTSGYITTTQTLNAPSSLNVCGMGAILTSASNLGSTAIRRYVAPQSGLNGSSSILRYFDITPTSNAGLNATIIFKYDDSELNGKPEGSLQLFRSTNTGSSWTIRGGTINTTTNEITLSGIDAFSRWSAGSGYFTSSIKVIPQGLYNSTSNRLNRKDTVRAYLRNISSPYGIIDSAKSIIDSVTFTGNFIFTNAPSGNYYVQTKHRNSLETWSKSGGEAYNLGSAFSYDFTTASSQAFGNNLLQADAAPVKYAIYTGDVNQDGSIDLTDVIQTYNDANNFVTGYVVTDLNRDNITDLTDVLIAYNNSVNFVVVIRPYLPNIS